MVSLASRRTANPTDVDDSAAVDAVAPEPCVELKRRWLELAGVMKRSRSEAEGVSNAALCDGVSRSPRRGESINSSLPAAEAIRVLCETCCHVKRALDAPLA